MPIDTLDHEKGTVINVSGVFDRATSAALEETLRQEARKGKPIVINLYDVNYISSVSLGTLIKLHNELSDEAIRLAISNVSDECRKIFEMVELEKILPVYDDDEKAFDNIGKNDGN
jgi:anti-anti-sigma factor